MYQGRIQMAKITLKIKNYRLINMKKIKITTQILQKSKFRPQNKSKLSQFSKQNQETTTLREFEADELCAICLQPFEMHSFDLNLDLIGLAQKYDEILNQVTKEGIDSLNQESYLSFISHRSRIKIPELDNSPISTKTIQKIKLKQKKLSENLNYDSENILQLQNNDYSELIKSKGESWGSKVEEVRIKDRSMIEKSLKYCKILNFYTSIVEQKYPELNPQESQLLRSEQK